MWKHSRIERSWIERSWMRAVCVTICLLAAGPAGAQSPSPDTLAAARELIVTMRAADYFKTIMPAIVQQLKPAIGRTGRRSSVTTMPSCRSCSTA